MIISVLQRRDHRFQRPARRMAVNIPGDTEAHILPAVWVPEGQVVPHDVAAPLSCHGAHLFPGTWLQLQNPPC